MLADNKDERSLADIAKRCGFGGMSQFSRAFRARFGAPPRQYLALVRQQDLDWHEARLAADGFDQDAFFWRRPEGSEFETIRWPGRIGIRGRDVSARWCQQSLTRAHVFRNALDGERSLEVRIVIIMPAIPGS